jgi:UDP-glucose 4,6-dehydratase
MLVKIMITLIGHGYIGDNISKELTKKNIPFHWIHHYEKVPIGTGIIINAAGFTGSPNVDACEIYKQETIDGNVIFPVKLEQLHRSIPIVHISSGCIYTGYKEGGWTEEDEPNFNFNNGSFYSGSKNLEQVLLQPYMRKSYLLRIRMPFGDEHHPKNFLTKLINYEKLIDFENSLSYIKDIVKTVIHFCSTLPEPGIYNLCNPGSKRTKDIADMMGLNKEWFTEEEFKQVITAPRSNCVLNNEKLLKIFPIQDIDSALKEAIQNLK